MMPAIQYYLNVVILSLQIETQFKHTHIPQMLKFFQHARNLEGAYSNCLSFFKQ